METTFLFDMIRLMAGITAVFRLIGRLPESSADIRMPDGDRSVSGQLLPDTNEPVIQSIFRPAARNGVSRRPRYRFNGGVTRRLLTNSITNKNKTDHYENKNKTDNMDGKVYARCSVPARSRDAGTWLLLLWRSHDSSSGA
jgi:hypothetical protein